MNEPDPTPAPSPPSSADDIGADERYDAVLLVSFGGPEGPDDVVPFLENVTAGRGIPRERLAVVGAHYAHFDGISPINEQNRRIRAALAARLADTGTPMPVYWGNRNWDPYLVEAIGEMRDDGVRRALAVVTSAYSSYSGCRQYRENIEAARLEVGPSAPQIDKIRVFHDHPGFVEPFRDGVAAALDELGERPALVFTAHSIPQSMAETSDYEAQLRVTAALVAQAAPELSWELVWQSRSGPPQVPWLEPDINDHLRALAADGATDAVVVPIGFVSDHIEVAWDLDHEARMTATELGLGFRLVEAPGTEPDDRFVDMLVSLVRERTHGETAVVLGTTGPRPMPCATDCCPAPTRPRPPSA